VALASSAGLTAAAQVAAPDGAAPRGFGTFVALCDFSHRAPDDAIVFPGQPGRSHLHDFFANRTTNASSTPASLRSAASTTCHRPHDRSAYWVPTLYEGGGRTPVRPLGGGFYYNAGKRDFESIQPFPAGLQMIAGDSSARELQKGRIVDWRCRRQKPLEEGQSPSDSPRARELRAAVDQARTAMVANRGKVRRLRKAVRRLRQRAIARQSRTAARRKLSRKRRAYRRARRAFRRARNEHGLREAALQSYLFGGGTSIPTCRPGSNLELHVLFPDCWDGRNLDSPDHKSHMAYSSPPRPEQKVGQCPRSHPVLVPILHLHITYDSTGGPDVRLSPGDVDAGHADFVNGWDQDKLAQLVRDCLNVDRYCGGSDHPVKDDARKPADPAPKDPAPKDPPPKDPAPKDPAPKPPAPEPDPDPGPGPLPIPLP
jgi:Domain of unknown function (DUF1996)